MAVSPICLTFGVSCLVVVELVDPPITACGPSSDHQNQAQVGDGGLGVSIGVGAGELMGQPAKRTTTVAVDLGELKAP